MKELIKKIIRILYRIMAGVYAVQKDVILFNSNVGRNFTGNPKAIYLEMLHDERFAGKTFVWGFNKAFIRSKSFRLFEEQANTANTKMVRYGGLRYHYYLAVAGMWVFDGRQEDYYVKRKNCFYLQCWHGTPLKRLALDLESINMAEEAESGDGLSVYRKKFIDESAKWNLLLSQNPYSTEIFARCFGYTGEILGNGYPRNDALFDMERRERHANSDSGKRREKKVILYAPTWRDDHGNGDGTYKFVTNLDFERLANELGDDYILLCKAHYLVADSIRKLTSGNEKVKKFVKVVDPNADISELYLRSDILVTDYSSAMFDFMVLKRPVIFYMFDLVDYRDRIRGFYFDIIKDAPGPVCEDTEELINAVKYAETTDLTAYREYKEFFEKYSSFDDGKAAKRVLNRLAEV